MQNQSNNELDRLAEELTLRREVDGDGHIFYYNSNGNLHRIHGPAAIYSDNTKGWFQNGKYHRLDGPAFDYPDGTQFWYQYGLRHRLDGPAITFGDGDQGWFINGKEYTKEQFDVHPDVIAYAKSM